MLIELHVLQSFPVSNLNRDDLGQPKTATFGGHLRARISSQAQKAAARKLFTSHGLDGSELGWRTKRLCDATKPLLMKQKKCDENVALLVAAHALTSMRAGTEPNGLTQYLLFVDKGAAQRLADYCTKQWTQLKKKADATIASLEEKKEKAGKKKTGDKDDNEGTATKLVATKPKTLTDAAKEAALDIFRGQVTTAADIALFGRMLADNTDFNIDAACQVAHALSTHTVANEFDYYTAMDHYKEDAGPGADMIGTVDFNAACYYRYANLNLCQLRENVAGTSDDADLISRATRAWLQSFIRAIPTGKQNTMAASTPVGAVLGVVRTHSSWNLANAFLRPVAGVPDIMTESGERLAHHFEQVRTFYGDEELTHSAYASIDATLPDITDAQHADSINELVTSLATAAGASR